ncbi:UPF0481 protein [Vigna angularis]|uniref:UPF0481 protein n=1 Tax=Phaseolus angularis TaxID=3914 RepID=A0A8T0JV75_PHAAN|nr:UPF0481 protein At3g47200 isoform X1 [Vigna angularis]KAG2384444.1 UPF0481 protein [Vigna angularis]
MSATSISNLQERLQDLQKAKETPSPAPQNAKIQRVPPHLLRNRKNFSKYYSPKLVSFGPIHHGDLNLHLGEQYKKMWAAEYIGSTKISPQELHKKVVQNMESLKPLFDDDLFTQNQRFSEYEKQGYGSPEDMISWMLFVDGCALLHILEHAKLDKPYKMNVKVDQLVLVMQDALLLENQLPFPLLEHLWRDSKVNLMEIMKGFLRCHHWATKEDQVNFTADFPQPTHLLDLQRSIILYEPPSQNTDKKGCCVPKRHIGNGSDVSPENQDDMVTYRNIKELKAAGIEFMSSKTRRPADISFSLGWFHSTLKLPLLLC